MSAQTSIEVYWDRFLEHQARRAAEPLMSPSSADRQPASAGAGDRKEDDPAGDGRSLRPAYTAWGFGNSPAMADELGGLVLQGIKTGTATLLWEIEVEQEPIPAVGDFSIVLDGAGEPLCIIRTARVEILPFNQVGAEHADAEGEGDRSLAYWREAHWRFFGMVCQEIKRRPEENMPIVCERFEVVFR